MPDDDQIDWDGKPDTLKGEFERVNPKGYDKAGHDPEIIKQLNDTDTQTEEKIKDFKEQKNRDKSALISQEAARIHREQGITGQPAPQNINETARTSVKANTQKEYSQIRADQKQAQADTLARLKRNRSNKKPGKEM